MSDIIPRNVTKWKYTCSLHISESNSTERTLKNMNECMIRIFESRNSKLITVDCIFIVLLNCIPTVTVVIIAVCLVALFLENLGGLTVCSGR